MQEASPVLSFSPSFNTCNSSSRLTEIAARVVEELRNESDIDYGDGYGYGYGDDDYFCRHLEESSLENNSFNAAKPQEQQQPQIIEEEEAGGEEDFEFSFVCREPAISPISADEIFCNGQIRPVFPLFNTDLLLSGGDEDLLVRGRESVLKPRRRLSLGKLMTEERDSSPSCSSSEADDLEGLTPGTYCVWTPKKEADESEEEKSSSTAGGGKCKKSNSTGTSKRWRFRDLLNRSNSDGKDTFVFLTPSAKAAKKGGEEKVEKSVTAKAGKFAGIPKTNGVSGVGEVPSAAPGGHEAHYTRNGSMKEGDKRRSFLPYRQDLVGFFSNVNGLSRNLHPF